MNIRIFRNILIPAGMAMLFAACNDDGNVETQCIASLQFATQMDAPQTRATANNTWDGSETVMVSLDDAPAVAFNAAATGVLTPATPLYWTSAGISARAWYPAAWAMQADQSTADKQQAADFIFAPTVTGITRANAGSTPLVFSHRTAKVTANLTNGTGISASELAAASIRFYGYTSGMPSTTHAGNGAISGSVNGNITPLKSGNTYTALLIAQDMTAAQFIKVTIGSEDYYYKPAAGDAKLEAGKSYTYNITVNRTGLTVTVVSNGAQWGAGDTEDVTSMKNMWIETVSIPAGTFRMGSSDGSNIGDGNGSGLNTTPAEPNRYTDEKQHWVKLTQGFRMSQYAITKEQYCEFLNAAGVGQNRQYDVQDYGNQTLFSVYSDWTPTWDAGTSTWKTGGTANAPMVCVTWYGAKAFADWVGGALPTEAQWEYACRGGKENQPFGIGTGYKLDNTLANFYWNNSWSWDGVNASATVSNTGTYPASPQAAGSYVANDYGLYDMHGNVLEWCADNWNGTNNYPDGTTEASPQTDPLGTTGSSRVLRGGSWSGYARYCRSAYRDRDNPVYGYSDVGFRVVFLP